MNVLLWILQIALALLCLAGGAYKIVSFNELAGMQATAGLSRAGWGLLGAIEIACGMLLIIPAALRWRPALTPVAAAVLAAESMALAALYASHSLQIAATHPLVWVLVMAALALFVAYGRFVLRPLVRTTATR